MIHIFDSTMAGAPSLSGTAGTLLTVLRACLVNGFGVTAVQSITVASGVATVTFASAHPFKEAAVAEISGATPSALNGKKKILKATTYTITYAAVGVADGAATGSISSKIAPVGWTELFAGTATNIAAFKPSVAEATGAVLRVDDTGTTTSYVTGYTSMDDVNTGTNRFPSVTQSSAGLSWFKSGVATTAVRAWRVIADERGAYIFLNPGTLSNHQGMAFGDFRSVIGVDPYATVLNGATAWNAISVGDFGFLNVASSGFDTSLNCYAPKDYTGIGAPAPLRKAAQFFTSSIYSGASAVLLPFPSRRDNSMRLCEIELQEASGVCGSLPGVYACPQNVVGVFTSGELIAGQGAFVGRKLLGMQVGDPSTSSGSSSGFIFVDVTDNWTR